MTATLESDGAYEVTTAKAAGLPPGTYQVAVCPPPTEIPVGTFTPPKVKPYPNIPLKYRDSKTSGLTLVVHEGENRFDIDMTP